MLKSLCVALALVLAAPAGRTEPALAPNEARWIASGMPVIRYARNRALPVDIVVQPQDAPEASPIAMAIRDGRCTLVLSLRGNPRATALLASMPAALFDAVAEAVFAHELGHCWRYVRGQWNALPAGFADAVDPTDTAGDGTDNADLSALERGMRETRREEGFADLVGLAWTRRAHLQQYAQVRRWFERFRADATPGEHHDTGAWLRLAVEPGAFDSGDGPFREAQVLWERGLRARE